RRRHTRFDCDWSSDVCSSDLALAVTTSALAQVAAGIASGPPIWVVSLIGAMFAGTLALVGTFALEAMSSARASRGWRVATGTVRSEERRVGKEWRVGGARAPQ